MQRKTGHIPQKPEAAKSVSSQSKVDTNTDSTLFSSDMIQQMQTVFARMERQLLLKLYLDDSALSVELKTYMYEMAKLTDKLIIQENPEPVDDRPLVRICDTNGNYLDLAFHGVPGGHEFTSFMLGLYNAADPGQPLDDVLKAKAQSINKQTDIRILVSLSCTMCLELVMSAQRIAALNPNVSAEVYDLNHFPAWRETYNVMSVPCMIINDGKPMFGKKNIDQLLELI